MPGLAEAALGERQDLGRPDLEHLHAVLVDRLSKRREVAGFRTSVIFQQVRNTVLDRLDAPAPAP